METKSRSSETGKTDSSKPPSRSQERNLGEARGKQRVQEMGGSERQGGTGRTPTAKQWGVAFGPGYGRRGAGGSRPMHLLVSQFLRILLFPFFLGLQLHEDHLRARLVHLVLLLQLSAPRQPVLIGLVVLSAWH